MDRKQAAVYLRKTFVGFLEKKSHQSYYFQYSTDYLGSPHPLPLACCFPLQTEPFPSDYLHPFFDNLILEGWLLDYAEKAFHIDKKNRFDLLIAGGRSTIGAVSLFLTPPFLPDFSPLFPRSAIPHSEPLEFPHSGGFCSACLLPLLESSLHPLCEQALFEKQTPHAIQLNSDHPFEIFSETIYGSSISGAQRKGLFEIDTTRGTLSPNPIPSQFILKPEGSYTELVANEHLTMSLAQALGFKTPPFCLIQTPSLGLVFLIRRFDRYKNKALKMEDMAQVLGKISEEKYEGSHEQVGKAILQHTQNPEYQLRDYFRRILFCFLTANGDMHLKNWSLLETTDCHGKLELSPCYDFLNTRLAIPKEQLDLSLSLNGKRRKLKYADFSFFATHSLNLKKGTLDSLFQELPFWMETLKTLCARSYLSKQAQEKYIHLAEDRLLIFQNIT